ncbi:MAG: AAA family ATPase, partial [Anaerolineae bacterium]|nr:AAA family ATPase [Anaerolineae bacterium]
VVLAAQSAPIDTLQNALLPLRKHFHYCLIDTAPSLDALGLGTLYAADFVLVPTLCEQLALHGVGRVIATISDIRDTHGGTTKLLGII